MRCTRRRCWCGPSQCGRQVGQQYASLRTPYCTLTCSHTAAAVLAAIVVPRFHDKNKPEFRENPPTLKEVGVRTFHISPLSHTSYIHIHIHIHIHTYTYTHTCTTCTHIPHAYMYTHAYTRPTAMPLFFKVHGASCKDCSCFWP